MKSSIPSWNIEPHSISDFSSLQDLIRAAKEITIATTKAVAAGNTAKQDDIAAAGNMGRKAITDMLNTCKGASVNAESEALKLKV